MPLSPAPAGSAVPVYPPPSLIVPEESYTNVPTADLHGQLDAAVAGRKDFKVRIYRTLGDAKNTPELVREIPVGATPQFSVPGLTLEKGIDFFTATLIGPDGKETAPSGPVRFVYDTSKPKIVLTSPKEGETINAASVDVVGTVQSRSVVVARNEANGTSVSGKAGPTGYFSVSLPLAPGSNSLTLTSTDPAGNASQLVVKVLRGSGKLTASLTPSDYQFSARKLPEPLTLTAVVNDPDGHPVNGATVTFSVSSPGIDPVTHDAVTNKSGRAIFETTVPNGATVGNILATVLVDTKQFGTTSARTVIAVVK